MIVVHHPQGLEPLWDYIAAVVFRDFLGLDVRTAIHADECVRITAVGYPGALVMPDIFIQLFAEHGLSVAALPGLPLEMVPCAALTDDGELFGVRDIPVLYGCPRGGSWRYTDAEAHTYLGIDVLGSAMYMLGRFEELALLPADDHCESVIAGLPSIESGITSIPIIDVYTEVLWQAVTCVWPGVQRRCDEYRLCLSHDIDFLYASVGEPSVFLRRIAHDVLRDRDIDLAARRVRSRCGGGYASDPYNTFEYLMHVSERSGLSSEFYFMNPMKYHALNGDYDMNDALARSLVAQITKRGHQVGLHVSYRAVESLEVLSAEAKYFLQLPQSDWGTGLACRSHFLRWCGPSTWSLYEDVGIRKDSSLGFSQRIGFRCGVARAFRTFDLINLRPLTVLEEPLILMDHALMDCRTPADAAAAYRAAIGAMRWCRSVRGTMTILWHNSSVSGSRGRRIYEDLVSEGVGGASWL